MSKAFLTPEDEQAVIEAIKTAELNTSGEIRVHIEGNLKKGSVDERAFEVFNNLSMYATELRNGVLIYVAYKDKKFGIYGDKGINEVVPNDFWESTKNTMQNHFKQKDFKQGIVEGILKAGEQLKTYFPYSEDDTNELSNEISKG